MDDKWALSVTELNEYVRRKLAGDPVLRAVTVRGEVSGFKRYTSGHCYFALKDVYKRQPSRRGTAAFQGGPYGVPGRRARGAGRLPRRRAHAGCGGAHGRDGHVSQAPRHRPHGARPEAGRGGDRRGGRPGGRRRSTRRPPLRYGGAGQRPRRQRAGSSAPPRACLLYTSRCV